MSASAKATIVLVPLSFLPQMLPHLQAALEAGMTAATDIDLEKEFADVAAGKAQVWAILRSDRVIGAFLTSVVILKDGRRALDVYGLGGGGILGWGRDLSQLLIDYGKANACSVVVFKGRKALMRAYRGSGIAIVGQHGDGNYLYERAL